MDVAGGEPAALLAGAADREQASAGGDHRRDIAGADRPGQPPHVRRRTDEAVAAGAGCARVGVDVGPLVHPPGQGLARRPPAVLAPAEHQAHRRRGAACLRLAHARGVVHNHHPRQLVRVRQAIAPQELHRRPPAHAAALKLPPNLLHQPGVARQAVVHEGAPFPERRPHLGRPEAHVHDQPPRDPLLAKHPPHARRPGRAAPARRTRLRARTHTQRAQDHADRQMRRHISTHPTSPGNAATSPFPFGPGLPAATGRQVPRGGSWYVTRARRRGPAPRAAPRHAPAAGT